MIQFEVPSCRCNLGRLSDSRGDSTYFRILVELISPAAEKPHLSCFIELYRRIVLLLIISILVQRNFYTCMSHIRGNVIVRLSTIIGFANSNENNPLLELKTIFLPSQMIVHHFSTINSSTSIPKWRPVARLAYPRT